MTPRERVMPVVDVRVLRRGFEVQLPGRILRVVRTRPEVEQTVRENASGSAIRYLEGAS